MNCKDKKKFGGPGKRKQACKNKKCVNMSGRKVCELHIAIKIFYQPNDPDEAKEHSTSMKRSQGVAMLHQ